MTKLLNKRPLFFCFIALGFGIFFAKPILSLNAVTISFVISAFSIVCYLCIKHKVFLSLLLVIVSFLIGIGAFLISVNSFNAKDYLNNSLDISGRVQIVTNYEFSQNLILDNVYVNKEKINYNICVSIYSFGGYQEGDVISFNSSLNRNTLFTLGNFNSYYYKYNVAYSTSTSVEDITVLQTDNLKWQESLRLNVKKQLYNNMKPNEAGVSYASLFGDKAFIEDDIKNNFSLSGISHLLAVSGLHIGFIVAVLSYILKKLKVKNKVSFFVIFAFLALYCIICDFSSSVLRASIMFIVFEIANLFGKRYDRLNAWSLAGLICLIYRPLSVYDGGFLLSFACVLCIFMFAKPLQQKLTSWHLPKKLAGILGVMIPIQIGLLPLLSAYYHSVSVFSILVNFICVPIFEVFFMMLFVLSIIILILPFLGFLYAVPGFVIGGIISISNFFASLEWAIIPLTKFTSIFTLGIYATMFICSHYTNLRAKAKTICSCFLIGLCALCMVLSSYTLAPNNNKITVLNYYGETSYIIECTGITLAIGDFNKYSSSFVSDYLLYSRLYKADYFVSLNDFVPKASIYKNTISQTENGETNFIEINNNLSIHQIYYSNELFGVIIQCKNVKLLVCANNTFNRIKCLEFSNSYENFDLVLGNKNNVDVLLNYVRSNCALIGGKYINSQSGTKIMVGNFSFNINQNNLENVRGVD